MSAAALDAQLTALSTGASVTAERPEKQGFPHEFMLHRNELDCHCPAPCSRSQDRSWVASGMVVRDAGEGCRARKCSMNPATWTSAQPMPRVIRACGWADQRSSTVRPRVSIGDVPINSHSPISTRCHASPGSRGTAGIALRITASNGVLPGAQRFFGGRVDSRNSSVCSTWTMRPASGVRMRSNSSSVARRPISEVGWRTVVRAG